MFRAVTLLQLCVLLLIILPYHGRGFVLQVTRSHSGDLFNNFSPHCSENVSVGKSGCEEKNAECLSSKDCCICRCKIHFSTLRISGIKAESTCIDDRIARHGCEFHFQNDTLDSSLSVVNLSTPGFDWLLYNGHVIPQNMTSYEVVLPVQILKYGTWTDIAMNPGFEMKKDVTRPFYRLQWNFSLASNYEGRLLKIALRYGFVTSCIVFKIFGTQSYNFETLDSSYNSATAKLSLRTSYTQNTHTTVAQSAIAQSQNIFTPIQSTTHSKSLYSSSWSQTRWITVTPSASPWATKSANPTLSTQHIHSSLSLWRSSSTVSSGSTNTTGDTSGKATEFTRIVIITSGICGAIFLAGLIVVPILLVVRQRRKTNFIGVTRTKETLVFKKTDVITGTEQSMPTTRDGFCCPSKPTAMLCNDRHDASSSAVDERALIMQEAIELLNMSQGNTSENSDETAAAMNSVELSRVNNSRNQTELGTRDTSDKTHLIDDSLEQERSVGYVKYHHEDEYERPREHDQLMKNEIYANYVNGNYSRYANENPICSCESKSEGAFNDNIVYENDRQHATFMYKNDVSLTEEIYINDLITKDESCVNASEDGMDLDFEGEYVYADVHSTAHAPRHNVSTQEKTSTAVGAIDGGTRTDVAKENRIISRFSTDICPPTKVDSKEINDLENIYENNNFQVVLGSDDVGDEIDMNNKDDEQDEIYVQMHSGSRRRVDNGDYLLANQEGQNVNGEEFGQLYANVYEYSQDEKGDFYANLTK